MRPLGLFVLTVTVFAAAILVRSNAPETNPVWVQVGPQVWKTREQPYSYALVESDAALLFGATTSQLPPGVTRAELCLLTHHHRDSSSHASDLLKAGVPVRAPQASANWLTREGIERYWETSLQRLVPDRKPALRDRTFGDWSYLVHPESPQAEGRAIACDLDDGQTIEWRSWTIRSVATPGHSRDHLAYLGLRKGDPKKHLFCGDAFCRTGSLWSPYTTDWHHATDEGLVAAAKSLRRMAGLHPDVLYPDHGPVLDRETVAALEQTAKAVDEAAFLKSYEAFSKRRLGNPPEYAFLARDQVATPGDRPWTRVSEHLFLTGNTYVLASKDGPILVIDPFHPLIGQQIAALQKQHSLGPIETVLISHAHNDHYTGFYELPPLPAPKRYDIWSLDLVADVLEQPYRFCAPYVDVRSLPVTRRLSAGEKVRWREYEFEFRHLPGQTWFTMGFTVEIDGRRCFHVADNFFHADQFTGSGGWSGRNRGFPDGYAESAKQVLSASPDWVLAEHGGPYVFSAEDYRRRVQWGERVARTVDALSPSGRHHWDWSPTSLRPDPMLVPAAPGETVNVRLVLDNPHDQPRTVTVTPWPSGLIQGKPLTITATAKSRASSELTITVSPTAKPGRQILPLQSNTPADAFVVIEVRARSATD